MFRRFSSKQIAVFAIALIIAIGLGSFVYLKMRPYLKGAVVLVETPKDGESFSSPLINVVGTIKDVSWLTLNGNQLLADEGGHFERAIVLNRGYNIVTIEARDRFGRIKTKYLHLVLK